MERYLTEKQKRILNELSYQGVREVDDINPSTLKQIEEYQIYDALYLDMNNYLMKRWTERQIEENY